MRERRTRLTQWFDFAYAAGLYDYLAEPIARALTKSLVQSLRPGGMLVIANFAPELGDIGYMEAVMQWHLIYRDEAAVERLMDSVPREQVDHHDLFRDTLGNVVYLVVHKSHDAG